MPSDRFRGALSVAMLAGTVLAFMLPYLIYLQTVDGIVAHLQRGMAFTALEVPRQRLTLTGLLLYDAWLLAATWLAPVAALAVDRDSVRHSQRKTRGRPRVASPQSWSSRSWPMLVSFAIDSTCGCPTPSSRQRCSWRGSSTGHGSHRHVRSGLTVRALGVAALLVTMGYAR